MPDPAEPPFWVYVRPDGRAKVHHAACSAAQDNKVLKKPRVKAENKNWTPFAAYKDAREFAERKGTLRLTSVDCTRCKPGRN